MSFRAEGSCRRVRVEGVVVNLPEHRLYYYPKRRANEKQVVITYPVSIGKMDWHTPIGKTRVAGKQTPVVASA